MDENKDINFYKRLVKENFLSKRKDSLNRNKEHDQIVNLILGLFVAKGILKQTTGFKIYLLEPFLDHNKYFEEEQPKNFDILIFNKFTKDAVFIEVKSSFRTVSSLFSSFDDQVKVVEERKDELKDLLDIDSIKDLNLEYVICVPSKQKRDIITKVVREDKKNVILWYFTEITKTSPVLEMHLFGEENKELEARRAHKNNSLRKELMAGATLENSDIVSFLISSDICMKLEHYVPQVQQAK
jgi:hypothetical protein